MTDKPLPKIQGKRGGRKRKAPAVETKEELVTTLDLNTDVVPPPQPDAADVANTNIPVTTETVKTGEQEQKAEVEEKLATKMENDRKESKVILDDPSLKSIQELFTQVIEPLKQEWNSFRQEQLRKLDVMQPIPVERTDTPKVINAAPPPQATSDTFSFRRYKEERDRKLAIPPPKAYSLPGVYPAPKKVAHAKWPNIPHEGKFTFG